MKYEVTVENTKTGKAKKESKAKAATMLWIGTEPCYRAETNAHITAFFQRNACRLIERVAAERGIDLQAGTPSHL